MRLTHDAMLVSLNIKCWSGRRYDREVSNEVADAKAASRSVGRYNKLLLPKACFTPLAKLSNEARATHYKHTLPWDDKGSRLLTVVNHATYTAELDTIGEKITQARREFIRDFPTNMNGARLELGDMFRLADYPAADHLPGKFSLRYRILPVPDVDHFMAKLTDNEADRVKRDLEAHIGEQIGEAVTDLYRRLGEAVSHVNEKLVEDDEGKALIFRNSLVENVRELVDIVPRLNIFGDDKLACLCDEVKAKIAKWDPDQLRPTSERFKPEARKQVKRDAADLKQAFAGYFGGAS